MLCPNCKKPLEEHTYDGINVQHCTYCGGTFFDQNEINRISLDSARDLAADRQAESISGAEKLCPIDHTGLKRTQQQSIPQHVSLLKCPKCKGVFSYPDDLVEFKLAQKAKIDYFKVWEKPLPGLKSVMVASFLIAISLAAVTTAYYLTRTAQVATIQAKEICKTKQIIRNKDKIIALCSTETAFSSYVKAFCADKTYDIQVNTEPSTLHTVQIPLNCHSMQYFFTSGDTTLETDIIPLP